MRLFIGNLPFGATEDDLQAMFQSVGVTADSIQVMRDKFSGKSRGFGFADITVSYTHLTLPTNREV